MASSNLNPFLLAATVPDPDPRLLPFLRAHPAKASEQDGHGYSLLHAAASYNHADLLRALVDEFRVDVNLKDEDGETCLFVSESEEVAKCLVEELGVDTTIRNEDGQTAGEKIVAEDDYPAVAAYLLQHHGTRHDQQTGPSALGTTDDIANSISHPPRLPPNMNINFGAVTEDQLGEAAAQEPDPEFRRRIEALAAKDNFDTDEAQKELRDLITDAVRGVHNEERDVRRRIE